MASPTFFSSLILATILAHPSTPPTDLPGGPTPDSLRSWHDLLGAEPHVAGSDGDQAVIENIANEFRSLGLETEVWTFQPLLARPVRASLSIVGEDPTVGVDSTGRRRRGVFSLALSERELLDDPSTRHPDLDWGWNAYSGSGEVEANVVYANYGRLEDFAKLRELGVDCTGKIVLARYGGNYRGYKVRFAQEAGAAGVVMFLDPGDYGDDRGPTWPQGGWANETCIQRGSIATLGYKGDPLTPFVAARGDAKRLDPSEVDLPRIPVQPIGYAAANRIMAGMTGMSVEEAGLEGWDGGLDVPYRLGGDRLRLRLEVEQERLILPTANVFGVLPGSESPEELVIVGCHHDAWGFGAADPLAGTIVLMETAKICADAAKAGWRPRRSIMFAAWGAEEFGIIGSSEWVESEHDRLRDHAVAFINLDMAAMGTRFGAAATPSLANAVLAAAATVPDAGDPNRTVADVWADQTEPPRIGELGGGSDHVGFVCHVGVPSIKLTARGSEGVAYHSNYDTLAWYRSTVGEGYEGALMLSRICAALVEDLADSAIPPLDPGPYADAMERSLEQLRQQVADAGLGDQDLDPLAREITATVRAVQRASVALEDVPSDRAAEVSDALMRFDRAWIDAEGLPGRPWYRNLYVSSDRDSGYGSMVFPGLFEAVRDRDAPALARAVTRYRAILGRITAAAEEIVRAAQPRK